MLQRERVLRVGLASQNWQKAWITYSIPSAEHCSVNNDIHSIRDRTGTVTLTSLQSTYYSICVVLRTSHYLYS